MSAVSIYLFLSESMIQFSCAGSASASRILFADWKYCL